MSDEYVPDSIIIVNGSMEDIERVWLCCHAPFGRIYCTKNSSCTKCEIADAIKKRIEKQHERIEEDEH